MSLTSQNADLQLHLPNWRLALFQFLHQNIIAGIEIMRIGWHQKARLKHHLKARLLRHSMAFPPNKTRGTQTNQVMGLFWKWMAALTYIKWIHFISLCILSFLDFVLRSLCSMRCLALLLMVSKHDHGLFWDVGRSMSWIGRPHCLAVSIGQLADGCTHVFFPKEQLSVNN